MVYDRRYDERILNFEPSGGLLDAALVMRDRETDSWWAIMRGEAIGGPLSGTRLKVLPLGEKTTWGEWRQRHPGTRVLIEGGRTHEPVNRYAGYLSSERTFRQAAVEDQRLPAKEPIFAFRLGDRPYVVPHARATGGRRFRPEHDAAHEVFLFRPPGAPTLESTAAYLLPAGLLTRVGDAWVLPGTRIRLDRPGSLARLAEQPGVTRLAGFDTFWYTWVAVNPGTRILD